MDGGIQVSPSLAAENKAKQLDSSLNYAMDEVNLNIMISSIDRKKNNKKSTVSSENSNKKL